MNDALHDDLLHARRQHASNLGGLIAQEIAAEVGVKAYIADPVVVDEMIPYARISGLPQLPRESVFHALNQKAIARRYARETGRKYEELNLIVSHMGGGITVSDLMREKKSVRLTFTAAAISSTERFELEMLSMTYWFTCAMKRLPEGLAASPSMTR